MSGILNFWTFVATAAFFVITPGGDTLFVLNKSIGQGRRAGLYSTLGINAGLLIHTLAAALGVSVLIANSALAFALLKYAGAAYLVYLGVIKLLMKTKSFVATTGSVHQSERQHFTSGLLTNLFNPQVALFVLAFFPQFVNPQQTPNPLPFIVLGVTQSLLCLAWFSLLVVGSANFARTFKKNPRAENYLNRVSSVFFIGMGVWIALSEW